MSTDIPGDAVVSGYIRTERSLRGVLDVIPYCEEHANVWSDHLASVLLEAGSLLDSLWRAQSMQSRLVREKRKRRDLDMFDYFRYFGEYMTPKWLVFWAEQPTQLYPFSAWSKTGDFKTKQDYAALDWWNAYNSLKHDRFENRKKATLQNATCAVAGLFLAILRCEACRPSIAETGWMSGGELAHPEEFLSEESDDKFHFVVAETGLFTYAIGWGKEPRPQGQCWRGDASQRFHRWFNQE